MAHVTMQDFEEHDWTVGRNYLSIGRWEGERGSYRESLYRHTHGLVEVYESLGAHGGSTSMRFRYQGHEHVRRWKTYWGDRTIARLAREFVEEVTNA